MRAYCDNPASAVYVCYGAFVGLKDRRGHCHNYELIGDGFAVVGVGEIVNFHCVLFLSEKIFFLYYIIYIYTCQAISDKKQDKTSKKIR